MSAATDAAVANMPARCLRTTRFSITGQLWVSGRYNRVVYVLSTKDGSLVAKIPVNGGPHGLCVWPQPGRYSIGHTGILR